MTSPLAGALPRRAEFADCAAAPCGSALDNRIALIAVARRQSLRATVFIVVRVFMKVPLLVDSGSAALCRRSPQLTSPNRRGLDGTQSRADQSTPRAETRAPDAHAPRVTARGKPRQRGAKALPVTAGSGAEAASQHDQRRIQGIDQDRDVGGELGRGGVDHLACDAVPEARCAADLFRIVSAVAQRVRTADQGRSRRAGFERSELRPAVALHGGAGRTAREPDGVSMCPEPGPSVHDQGRTDARADSDVQERWTAACRAEARFGECRRPHVRSDRHGAVRGKRTAHARRPPGQDRAAFDLALRPDELGHADAHLVHRQSGPVASFHDLARNDRRARERLPSATGCIRRDRSNVPDRPGSRKEEPGPDAGAADVDAEHAALAIARTAHAARGATHGRYPGATPSMAVAAPENDSTSYCPVWGMNTASRGPGGNVVDCDFQCVRIINSPERPTIIASPPCAVFSPVAPAGTWSSATVRCSVLTTRPTAISPSSRSDRSRGPIRCRVASAAAPTQFPRSWSRRYTGVSRYSCFIA